MSMGKTVIYGLCDPRDGRVRYVGKSNNPKSRLRGHIQDSKKDYDYPVHRWIRKLAKDNVEPVFIVLEEVSTENWRETERRWIAHYHQVNGRMLNVAPGGEGVNECHVERGTDRYNVVLNDELVLEMRQLRRDGMILRDLSLRFGVNIATVSNICRGVYWKHVGGPLTKDIRAVPAPRKGESHPMAKLSESDVREIRSLYKAGTHSQNQLAKMYNVTQAMIWYVVKEKNWK